MYLYQAKHKHFIMRIVFKRRLRKYVYIYMYLIGRNLDVHVHKGGKGTNELFDDIASTTDHKQVFI